MQQSQTVPPNILVIEDDPDTRLLITDALTDHFQSDCVAAISTVAESEDVDLEPIDVVLCDYNLPDGCGIDILRSMIARQSDILFIMLTGEREVELAIEAIHAGAADYVLKTPQLIDVIPLVIEKNLVVWRIKQENLALQSKLEDSVYQVQDANAQLQTLVVRLEQMALTDDLTGLYNRRHLSQTMNRMFSESIRYDTELSCLMIDLDGFKQVNDTLGHQKGDDLLIKIGHIITSNCRESDVPARYGGDEFVILLPETNLDTAVIVAERMRKQFDNTRKFPDSTISNTDKLSISISVGIASRKSTTPNSAEHLIADADNALYSAKRIGRKCTMIYCGKETSPKLARTYMSEAGIAPDSAA